MNPFAAATSWFADDTMAAQARLGVPVSSQVYSELDETVLLPPSDITLAYQQVIYLTALAARRADWDNLKAAQNTLFAHMVALEEERDKIKLSTLCTYTGYGCPAGNTSFVLNRTKGYIQGSGLHPDDIHQITELLKANILYLNQKKILIWGLVAAGVSGSAYFLFYRKGR
jgi:hypothetical protein